MFLSVRQDVHARMSGDAVRIFLLQVGTPPLLITGLWPHTASKALLPATTDRFFNGLLQQHHFGPREIDFLWLRGLGRPFRLPR